MNSSSQKLTLSDLDYVTAIQYYTASVAAIQRWTGLTSHYAMQANRFVAGYDVAQSGKILQGIFGVLLALRDDIAADHLTTFEQLLHADIFSDFLEMAEYLLSEGYKDPAAVQIGGVLEEHLRKLARKHGISVENKDARGDTKPKKADAINAELAGAGVYNKLEQKNITAWLDLRNKAAHAQYLEYQTSHVVALLQGVRDFIVRYPA